MSDARYDYLIVGGGMVADAAARGIRELDEGGSIGILSADVDPPYTRPALTKKLWTDPDFGWDQVPLNTVDDTGAELRLDTVVTAIDRDDHLVSLADGGTVGYGKLLLATGSTPKRLDAPDDERIIYFRSARDYLALREQAGEGTRVLVVGGGYIGAELAAALVTNGARVILVHPELGGRTVEKIGTEGSGLVARLDDGYRVGADVVVAGLGVRPVIEMAEEAGLEVEDGVIVDEHLQTTDRSIWAAGDIALYPDAILGATRVEHVDNAQEMGRAVGRSMAGDPEPYRHTPFFYSQVFDTRWEAVGDLDAQLETVEDWIVPGDQCVVYYLDGEAAVGVLLWRVADRTDAARAVLADPPARREELVGRIR